MGQPPTSNNDMLAVQTANADIPSDQGQTTSLPQLLQGQPAAGAPPSLETLITAADGDLQLVAELLGTRKHEVLLNYLTSKPDVDPIEAYARLTYLQLFTAARDDLLGDMDNISDTNKIKLLEIIIGGLKAPTTNNNNNPALNVTINNNPHATAQAAVAAMPMDQRIARAQAIIDATIESTPPLSVDPRAVGPLGGSDDD